jgi:hypothetical protein
MNDDSINATRPATPEPGLDRRRGWLRGVTLRWLSIRPARRHDAALRFNSSPRRALAAGEGGSTA